MDPRLKQGLHLVGSKIKAFLPSNIAVLLAAGYIASVLTRLAFREQLSILVELLFCLAVGIIVERIVKTRENKVIALGKLNASWNRFAEINAIIESFFKITNKDYSTQIEEYMRQAEATREKLLNNSRLLYKRWADKINVNERWYVLLHRMLIAQKTSIEKNNFSLPLRDYLDILLDGIRLGVHWARLQDQRLHIYSFTNALPSDWFRRRNVIVGDAMESYSEELSKSIRELKKKNNVYRRLIICSNSMRDQGIKSKEEVLSDWRRCDGRIERPRYLKDLHTSDDDALLLELHPGILLSRSFSELIYFGLQQAPNKPIEWKWCYACGYTSDNLNVSASFHELSNNMEKYVIDIENTERRRFGEFGQTPERIQVSLGDFPVQIDKKVDDIGKIVKVKDLMPLAEKWKMASEIWHDDREAGFMKEYFNDLFKKNSRILDCACGTGFHSFILHNNGYNVIGSDIDPINIEIMQNKMSEEGYKFPVVVADWNSLERDITRQVGDEKYDAIICLGSSITYFESWNEYANSITWQRNKLENIVKIFSKMLRNKGKLVIGFSRHYRSRQKEKTKDEIRIGSKIIDSVSYEMVWKLECDWSKRAKLWYCSVLGDNGDDYSFELKSHLFDVEELKDICSKKFMECSVNDVDESLYDIFLVCTK